MSPWCDIHEVFALRGGCPFCPAHWSWGTSYVKFICFKYDNEVMVKENAEAFRHASETLSPRDHAIMKEVEDMMKGFQRDADGDRYRPDDPLSDLYDPDKWDERDG